MASTVYETENCYAASCKVTSLIHAGNQSNGQNLTNGWMIDYRSYTNNLSSRESPNGIPAHDLCDKKTMLYIKKNGENVEKKCV